MRTRHHFLNMGKLESKRKGFRREKILDFKKVEIKKFKEIV